MKSRSKVTTMFFSLFIHALQRNALRFQFLFEINCGFHQLSFKKINTHRSRPQSNVIQINSLK